MKTLLLILLTSLLVGCAPKLVEVPVTQLVEVAVTRPVEVTREIVVTRNVIVTKLIEVTPISTSTPLGPTATLQPTRTPIPTPDLTRQPKGEGSYLAGKEMALGVWRSTRITNDFMDGDCYISVEDFGGDIYNNSLSPLGATIRIPAGDYIVLVDNCVWEFLQP